MTSRDYERALAALGNITSPDETVRSAAQLLAFNRAVELFQNNQRTKALTFFKRARENNVDPQLHAETFYWEGEILYKKGNYTGAAAAYAAFSTTQEATSVRCTTMPTTPVDTPITRARSTRTPSPPFGLTWKPIQRTTPLACATPNSVLPIASMR